MKKIIVLLSLIFLSCDFTENRFVTIKNESKSDIVCFISKIDINYIKNVSEMNSATEINKNEFAFLVPVTKGKWEDYLEKCEMKKARIYIIVKDSIDKYGWGDIYKKGLYNQRSLFSIEDLEKNDWKIVYYGNQVIPLVISK